jgi:hypothetical protein
MVELLDARYTHWKFILFTYVTFSLAQETSNTLQLITERSTSVGGPNQG